MSRDYKIEVTGSAHAIDALHKLMKYCRHIGKAGGSDCLKSVSGDFEFCFDGDGLDKIRSIRFDVVEELEQ